MGGRGGGDGDGEGDRESSDLESSSISDGSCLVVFAEVERDCGEGECLLPSDSRRRRGRSGVRHSSLSS